MTEKEQLEALEMLLACDDIHIRIKVCKSGEGIERPVVLINDSGGFVWGRGYSLEDAIENIDISRVKSIVCEVVKG